ncbi:MAG: adenylate/guanylate cyclase domain-containing protein [Propylenella sp.]
MSEMLRWLQSDGARFRETAPFIDAFARALLRSGIEVARVTTGVPILHPQVYSLSCLWEEGHPVTERRFRQEGAGLQAFQNSPMAIVYEGGSVRCRLDLPPQPGEFPILADLRAEGMTDYLALPLAFSDGSWKAITYATRRRGGFSDEQAALLQELVPTLSMILEIQALHRTTLTLLDTYVGRSAGRRVLDGAIKRGMSETIRAVIWTCDLRDFTGLSEELPGDELVALLNDYFGAMTDAIDRHGGEVLKFIGDALLGIFPLTGEEERAVAARALTAAKEADAAIRAINAERSGSGRPAIRFGLALHVGDVLYGNIGGTERLDFTVIGQAVNVATRIEGLTKELGRNVLLSREMAELCGDTVEPLGMFALKGVAGKQAIYAPIGVSPAPDAD